METMITTCATFWAAEGSGNVGPGAVSSQDLRATSGYLGKGVAGRVLGLGKVRSQPFLSPTLPTWGREEVRHPLVDHSTRHSPSSKVHVCWYRPTIAPAHLLAVGGQQLLLMKHLLCAGTFSSIISFQPSGYSERHSRRAPWLRALESSEPGANPSSPTSGCDTPGLALPVDAGSACATTT